MEHSIQDGRSARDVEPAAVGGDVTRIAEEISAVFSIISAYVDLIGAGSESAEADADLAEIRAALARGAELTRALGSEVGVRGTRVGPEGTSLPPGSLLASTGSSRPMRADGEVVVLASSMAALGRAYSRALRAVGFQVKVALDPTDAIQYLERVGDRVAVVFAECDEHEFVRDRVLESARHLAPRSGLICITHRSEASRHPRSLNVDVLRHPFTLGELTRLALDRLAARDTLVEPADRAVRSVPREPPQTPPVPPPNDEDLLEALAYRDAEFRAALGQLRLRHIILRQVGDDAPAGTLLWPHAPVAAPTPVSLSALAGDVMGERLLSAAVCAAAVEAVEPHGAVAGPMFLPLDWSGVLDPPLDALSGALKQHAQDVVLRLPLGALAPGWERDARRAIESLRGLGYRWALDIDRGVFTRLRVLQQLRPDFVFLSPRLTRTLTRDPEAQRAQMDLVAHLRRWGARTVAQVSDNGPHRVRGAGISLYAATTPAGRARSAP